MSSDPRPHETQPLGNIESRSPAIQSETESMGQRRFGAVLVLLVVMLYVGSSVMIQVLFDEMRYEKPFFFSYVSVAMCSIYLLHSGFVGCHQMLVSPKHAYSKELQHSQTGAGFMAPLQLLRPAVSLAPSYFCLNYTYFFSLDLTSVSSTMILSASTGVWTLFFSFLLLGEPLTRLKTATVLISILGMCLVTASVHSSPAEAAEGDAAYGFSGDVLALMSAAASGVYMVLLPVSVPDKDSVHMPTLFGMIGLVCAVLLLPLFPLLHYGGVERFELPPSRSAALALIVNAATSTVLPDMLLARAVMMTSPLVATLGLSLMIPLSVFTDYVRGLARLSPQFFFGTACVFISYLLESWAEVYAERGAEAAPAEAPEADGEAEENAEDACKSPAGAARVSSPHLSCK